MTNFMRIYFSTTLFIDRCAHIWVIILKKLTYQVGVVYCRESVCDDKTCSSLSSLIQRFLNNLVRERVQTSVKLYDKLCERDLLISPTLSTAIKQIGPKLRNGRYLVKLKAEGFDYTLFSCKNSI